MKYVSREDINRKVEIVDFQKMEKVRARADALVNDPNTAESLVDRTIINESILSNDIEKVNLSTSIFSALFTPQGKYLFEFFLIHSKNGYLLDCDNKFTNEIINYLLKYKLRPTLIAEESTVKGAMDSLASFIVAQDLLSST